MQILALAASLFLMLSPAAAFAAQTQEDKLPVEKWPPDDGPDELRPGWDLFHLVPQQPLPRSPFRISSNNLLHAMFGFLPMESAHIMEEGRMDVVLNEDISYGKLQVVTPDIFFRYDAMLLETNFELRAGLYDDWEVHFGVDMSNLLEENDDIILTHTGGLLIQEGDRTTTLGDFRLAVKRHLFSLGSDGECALIAGTKIPLSRSKQDLLTSGGVDFAANLLYTQMLGPLAFHVNVGAIIPGDIQTFESDVDTRNALAFGVGMTFQFADWGLLALQFQGNQSVFGDSDSSIAPLDDAVLSVHGGTRLRLGSYFLELSAGSGLNDRSSDWIVTTAFVVPLQ
ncbi:MAG: hypothetical protein HYY16_02100 [Planctomycetes bacterium]|nr:hypothetical protein [Planctomycetota bacterium]